MKLFFDARYIRTDFHDGISRYTHELALALAQLTRDVTFLVANSEQKTFLPKGAKTLRIHAVDSWREPFTALILNKYKPDVVVTPLQSMGSFGRKFKLILNQQDMTYYRHAQPPHQLTWPVRLGWRLYHLSYWPGRLTLNAADIVATVSETSKQEILAARLTKRPIIVVPNAARDLSEYLKKPVVQGINPPKNLVYMGAFLPYKNVEVLIQALAYLPGRTLHLLSRVTDARRHDLEQLIPDGADVRFHGGVSDKEYAALLANDAIMVSASKSEGYGLPLAEALKLGVPAVVSDMPVFHEVAGQGALFADPGSPKSFANAIKKLDKKSAREQIVKKGRLHTETFSWGASAETLLAACEQLTRKS